MSHVVARMPRSLVAALSLAIAAGGVLLALQPANADAVVPAVSPQVPTIHSGQNGPALPDAPARVSAADECAVQAATFTWGFKESFRSYISGSIANGEWTVADGATYETPNFGWVDGKGVYDFTAGKGLLAFVGSITFTGHGGILNTTVSDPRIEFIDNATAVMIVDIAGTTQDGAEVDEQGVEFLEIDLTGTTSLDGGTFMVTDAPAILTADGSAAFGTYEEGETFDPIVLELEFDPACATVTPPEVTAPPEEPTDTVEPVDEPASLSWVWLVGALVVVAIVVVIVVAVRRKR